MPTQSSGEKRVVRQSNTSRIATCLSTMQKRGLVIVGLLTTDMQSPAVSITDEQVKDGHCEDAYIPE